MTSGHLRAKWLRYRPHRPFMLFSGNTAYTMSLINYNADPSKPFTTEKVISISCDRINTPAKWTIHFIFTLMETSLSCTIVMSFCDLAPFIELLQMVFCCSF